MSIVFALERTNQLSLLPDKDLVDLCPPIEPYQVTKNPFFRESVSSIKKVIKLCLIFPEKTQIKYLLETPFY
ncbi:MAG: hypothetical protein PX481_04895 [Microcystis sp. M53603_WE2]|uniref:hypothetical protein n=1 Tax=unclassified Microcystis TaxID=2643300 RepID=UPI0022C4914F|nr:MULTISPECIES: hypothetical protein [unclassified Microcystis]MCZ8027740.1 hypothetical protein [Microcystis sp. LE19-10.1B]MDJ0524598.1 hypothetical protein [Microcystis sp. M53600_WE12]MDJ0538036.1 hypothetical protein [Microcystis sp. M53603_WE2]MDJ0606485.1 hypothetical protein [Microcystis sp. M53602_WE12]